MQSGMGGQRKSRVIIAVAAGVLIAIYVLYGYRQAYNDVQLRTRDLNVARVEFQALSKRFDMLSNELKGKLLVLLMLNEPWKSSRHCWLLVIMYTIISDVKEISFGVCNTKIRFPNLAI